MRAGKNKPKLSKFSKIFDLSLKIAPDLKEKWVFVVFVAKNFKNWASFGVKMSIFLKKWGLWVTAHNFVKNMGYLGEIVKIYGVFGWGRC